MTIPDEMLAAYVDGELEGAERARIEQAIEQDAQLAQRVAQQRALRDRLRGAYNGVLQEAVPQRLAQAVKRGTPSGPAQVIDLARVRAERARRGNGQRQVKMRRYSIAASLAVGLMAGIVVQRLAAPGAVTEFHDGTLLARGALAQALNEQLASSPVPGAAVRVGLSFRSRSGNYCRTFALGGARSWRPGLSRTGSLAVAEPDGRRGRRWRRHGTGHAHGDIGFAACAATGGQ